MDISGATTAFGLLMVAIPAVGALYIAAGGLQAAWRFARGLFA